VRDIVMTPIELVRFLLVVHNSAMKQLPYSTSRKIRPDHPDISSSCSLPHVLALRCSSRLRVCIRTAEFIIHYLELHIWLCQWKMGMKIRSSINMHKNSGEIPMRRMSVRLRFPPRSQAI
jgi:hypothetical protein